MTPGFTDTQWEQFLASIEGHTEGPWQALKPVASDGLYCLRIKAQPSPAMRGFIKDIGAVWLDLSGAANAALIAASPTLVEEVKWLRAENARLACNAKAVVDAWKGDMLTCLATLDIEIGHLRAAINNNTGES